MVEWVKGFLIPLVEILIIGGVLLWVGFYVVRGILWRWHVSLKWFFKYTIFRKPHPPATVEWCINAVYNKMSYAKVQQFLLIKGIDGDRMRETLWIYEKVLKQMNKKGNQIFKEDKNVEKDLPNL